ncbi:MAG: hypothetical protein V3V75_01445, partial [Thermoguttaceae bacterium]
LKRLDEQQRQLRHKSKTLDAAEPSIDRYQQLHDTAKEQTHLAEEIEPLKAKILASLQPQQGPAAPGPQPPATAQPNAAKAAEVLGGLADNAGKAMAAAADHLAEYQPAKAAGTQAEVIEKLDQVFMAAAPYQQLVQHAIDRQQGLAGQSLQAISPPPPAVEADEEKVAAEDEQDEVDHRPQAVDLKDAAWNQRFIIGYSEMIQAKARQGLKNMPPAEPEPEPKPEEQSPDPAEDTVAPAEGPEKPDPAEAARKQQEALRKAMQNAVELGPKLTTLTVEAAGDLEDDNPQAAIPKQQEAIELLKKMLPEQEQDKDKQDQKKDDEKKDNKKKKDNRDKKDQDKKDSSKDEDKKKDNEKDKKDKDKKDPDKKDPGKQDQEKKQQESKKQEAMAKQQAKAVLRKAKQRQDERREMEKILQRYLYRPEKVEKDW